LHLSIYIPPRVCFQYKIQIYLKFDDHGAPSLNIMTKPPILYFKLHLFLVRIYRQKQNCHKMNHYLI